MFSNALSGWADLAVVFLPLLGAFIAGFFHRLITARGAELVTCTLMVITALISCILFYQINFLHLPREIVVLPWITSGDFVVNWSVYIDQLTAVMLVVINVVSAVVHVYSVTYMHDDPHRARFMSYLSLFTFAMLTLVTSTNLLQMFFGWEGVGLASYLLIGFWNHKNSANSAAMKAFITNRVGDFGFALGIILCFWLFGTVEFTGIFKQVGTLKGMEVDFWGIIFDPLNLCTFLLFIGAMGKSAQLGLHVWLPDAMEGPTPVSALIHAATMVTAGVFMVARLSPLFAAAPDTMAFITLMGGLTAIVAAIIGLTQNDIKRVIAYSTMSQLGYMFFALGVGAFGAAVFHLMTHAFFKALLFLGAGSVIHALHHEQDLRRMGGLSVKIPITYAMMWVGSLALAGIPFFAGYYSKDIILESAFASDNLLGYTAYGLGIAAALLTAFYSWRLLFLAFHGKPRGDHHAFDHAHEAPAAMWAPLLVLVAGALFSGAMFAPYFTGEKRANFWAGTLFHEGGDVLHKAHHVPHWVALLPTVMGVLGIALAALFYVMKPNLPGLFAKWFKPLYLLSLNKFYIDEIYNAIFVKPLQRLGTFLWQRGDQQTIDRLGPDGVARSSNGIGGLVSRWQTGFIFDYAAVMIVGVVLFIGYILWRAGGLF
ncbi:MAG TPA: NADH-quinone oxidoreductase subunit L [Alphaproteobacteria bacterium]